MRLITYIYGILFTSIVSAQNIDTIRIMHYNVLRYGENGCQVQTTKDAQLRNIIGHYRPDIFTANEISNGGNAAASLRNNVLVPINSNYMQAPYSNEAGSNIINALYYNSSLFGLLQTTAITGNIRDIDIVRLYYKPATTDGDTLDIWCFVAHLKASFDFSVERGEAAQSIVNWINDHPEVTRFLIAGDFNIYNSSETAWKTFTGSGTGSPYFYDPVNALTGWSGPTYAKVHTQSPSDGVNDCATTGGMDNRFDFILVNSSIKEGKEKISLIEKSYAAFGNDGVSFNSALNCDATTSVPLDVCKALREVSDHLPVVLQLGFVRQTAVNDDAFQVDILGNPLLSVDNLKFRITTNERGRYYWEIVDILGRRMAADSDFIETPGSQIFEAVVANQLPAGQYGLIVRDAFSNAVMRKLLVWR